MKKQSLFLFFALTLRVSPLMRLFRHQQSYSCMPKMKSVISSHNKYVLSNFNSSTQQPDTCKCRKKPDCPLEGKCLQSKLC